ncbi:hypothetical protein J4G63_07570 [Aeromonas sobria]|uniref:hypothetical protein n=1 Tax=Aeromonas sobria TaxID=646 RepID=UPI0015876A12|nr:hypothetical protein [Aeromonas sobria]MBS4687105.1 hypothetical protein [Aeromonas sobria]
MADKVLLYCGLIRYATQPPDGHKTDAAPSLAMSLARQVVSVILIDLLPLGMLSLIASGLPESTDALSQFCGHSIITITTTNQILGQPVLALLH